MNKEGLIKSVCENVNGATKKNIAVVVDEVFDIIKNTIASNEKVNIAGFGSFEVVERAERKARNLRTGEEILVEASKACKFKAAKALKDAINA